MSEKAAESALVAALVAWEMTTPVAGGLASRGFVAGWRAALAEVRADVEEWAEYGLSPADAAVFLESLK